ncbi:hypothetical protein BKA61DRAFT_652331 [Leptodontidium sp. MPI-SDFR-AT-0119]|nr:hypothetical protein BKA61DRAFT_652331 [Leptodontidium sp. MPI-SDFR-AT-0119]
MSQKPRAPSNASGPPVKRARRGTKRSRAGCLTCKLRKVKCDEQKPDCSRCTIFGIKCDGYEQPKPRATIPMHIMRPQASTSKLLPAPSSVMKFENEMEQKHFQSFHLELVAELAGAFDNRFWNRLVMQGCQDEPFILKTVTALSALSTAKKLSQTGTHGQTISSTLSASHMEFAFLEYQKALQLMAVTLTDQPSPRKALMMCLLVCCFEGMAGNSLAAITHAKSGQKLLDEWMASHPYSRSVGEGIKSPANHLIEDEMIQAAAFFDLQIVGFFDTRARREHSIRKHEGAESLQRMPASFKTIDEARVYWQLIMKRIRHFVAEGVESIYQFPLRNDNLECPREPGVEYFSSGDCPTYVPTVPENVLQFQDEQRRYGQEIVSWRTSFRELYRRTRLDLDKRAIAAAQTLLIQSKIYQIVLAGITDTDNMSFDNYTSDFKDILSLCREVIQTKKDLEAGQFGFEMGIIPALHTTAKWCRDKKLRREAISLMQWYASKEGYWDSVMLAQLNTVLMEVEERGIEGDYIPEHARIRMVGFKANHAGGVVQIHYVAGSPRTGQRRCEIEYAWKLPGPWPPATRPVSNSLALRASNGDPDDNQ